MRVGLYFAIFVTVATCPYASPARCAGVAMGQAIQSLDDRSKAPAQSELETVVLTVTPAAEPVPALRHRFWPASLRSGDAGRHYLRAVILLKQPRLQPAWEEYSRAGDDSWVSRRLESEEDQRQAAEWLKKMPLDRVLDELRTAAKVRNNSLRLDTGDQPLEEIFATMLPEVQELRSVARLLQVDIRLRIRQGQYEEAIERIRFGFRLGSALSDHDFIIGRLVGAAISDMMIGTVEELAAAPNAPNLYWALATLPRPVAPVGSSARSELNNLKRFTAEALEGSQGRSAEHWTAEVSRLIGRMTPTAANRASIPPFQQALLATTVLAVTYPQAKVGLAKAGIDESEISRMSAAEAVLRWTDFEVQRVADDMQKWTLLPPQIGQAYLRASDTTLKKYIQENGKTAPVVLIGLLMPSVNAAANAETRIQVHADLLQTAEAVRAHAHQSGRLPKSLDNLKPLPALSNPRTGRPFAYRLEDEGQTAVLAADDSPEPWANRVFRIRLSDDKR